MIKLSRLRGGPFFLNPDLIESVEETPDTVITLVDGKKVIVAESAGTVCQRIVVCRATVLRVISHLEQQAPVGAPSVVDEP